jgi:hypothetical protein
MKFEEIEKIYLEGKLDTNKLIVIMTAKQVENTTVINGLGVSDLSKIPPGVNIQKLITENNQLNIYIEALKKQVVSDSFELGESSISPILWNGNKSELARIYKDLIKAGIINCTGRDFSKHFLDKEGKPLSEDFSESLTTNQDDLSKNQAILGVQKMIRKN